MGIIIMAVAVLLIHMLMNAVAIINPKIIPLPDVPVSRIRFNAIRSCSRCFSNAKCNEKSTHEEKNNWISIRCCCFAHGHDAEQWK